MFFLTDILSPPLLLTTTLSFSFHHFRLFPSSPSPDLLFSTHPFILILHTLFPFFSCPFLLSPIFSSPFSSPPALSSPHPTPFSPTSHFQPTLSFSSYPLLLSPPSWFLPTLLLSLTLSFSPHLLFSPPFHYFPTLVFSTLSCFRPCLFFSFHHLLLSQCFHSSPTLSFFTYPFFYSQLIIFIPSPSFSTRPNVISHYLFLYPRSPLLPPSPPFLPTHPLLSTLSFSPHPVSLFTSPHSLPFSHSVLDLSFSFHSLLLIQCFYFVSLLVSVHPLLFSPPSSFRSPFITSPPSFYLYTLIFSSLPLPLFRTRPSFLTHSFSLNPETSPSFPTRVLPTPPPLPSWLLFFSHPLTRFWLSVLRLSNATVLPT